MPAATKYPNLPDGFAEALRFARLKKRLTLREVGSDLGVNGTAINQFELGIRNINYEWAIILNEYYDLGISLPEPDLTLVPRVTRNRLKKPPVRHGPFMIVLEGEVVEVLTYRVLGPASTVTRA